MKTITLKVDDDIFDKFMILLELLPKNKISMISQNKDINAVSDDEQKEIEELLKNPECHEFSGFENVIEI